MLNFFRRKDAAARYMLGGILVLVSVAMVMFLIPGFGGGNTGQPGDVNAVATVNGQSITSQDLSNQINRMEQTQHLPAAYVTVLGRQLLDNLIMENALSAEAQRLGFSASPQEISAAIRRQMPELFPKGQFVGEQTYQDYIEQSQGMSIPQFEDHVRHLVLINKLIDLVTDGVRVSPQEVREEFNRQNQKAVFDYVALNPADLTAQVQGTPQELQAYYQTHAAQYQAPEKRQLDVLIADVNQFAARIAVTPADVQQYYEANRAAYSFPERVKLAHILFKTMGEPAAAAAKAKQQAEQVDQKAKAPRADFAALAKQYSQDDATASQGGEIPDWVSRGRMVPAVEQMAFSLAPGQVSEVITTEYGYEIVKVEAHEAAHVESEAQAAAQITQQIQQQQALNAAQNAMNEAQLEAAATPFAEIARKLGLQYIATPPVGRNDPIAGIGLNPEFENDVFASGVNSLTPVLQLPQGFVLAKVTAIQPPATQPYSAVAAQVERDYRQQQAQTLAGSRAKELATAARSKGLKAAAAALHLAMKTSPAVDRNGNVPDLGAISSFAQALFRLQPGQVGTAQVSGTQVVYALVTIDQPPAAEFEQQKSEIADSLLQQKRDNVFQAFQDQLKSNLITDGKIRVNDNVLKTTLAAYADNAS